MSSLRPNKKRAMESSLSPSRSSQLAESLGSRTRTSATFFSQQQLETLQAELEHERSLRLLDQKRAQQVHQRLEKQVALAVEEASESETLLDDVRQQSEQLTAQLRQARDDAVFELRSMQMEMHDRGDAEDDSMEQYWQGKCRTQEAQIQAQAENERAMGEEIRTLQTEMQAKLDQGDRTTNETRTPTTAAVETGTSDAPSALLTELNHVRIQLAESEREQRQSVRKIQDLQQHNKTLIQEREENRLAARRLVTVEQELQALSKEQAEMVAETENWNEFSKTLSQKLKGYGYDGSQSGGGPPEVSNITRLIEKARTKVKEADERVLQAEALAGKGSFNPGTTQVLHFQETPLMEALKEEISVLKRQLESVKGEKAAKSAVAVDPDKLNKRLKENFKEQISLFREGVYLMTGFKVDMLPGCDRPTFRVRSVYAEREEDQLLLK